MEREAPRTAADEETHEESEEEAEQSRETHRDRERVMTRGDELNSEEESVGSDDRYAQAAEILAESDQRIEEGTAPGGQPVERRRSEDTVDLIEGDTT